MACPQRVCKYNSRYLPRLGELSITTANDALIALDVLPKQRILLSKARDDAMARNYPAYAALGTDMPSGEVVYCRKGSLVHVTRKLTWPSQLPFQHCVGSATMPLIFDCYPHIVIYSALWIFVRLHHHCHVLTRILLLLW